MKKILLVSIIVGSIALLIGCGSGSSKYEKTMKEYATTFYNLHQKGNVSQTVPTVSIAQLKEAIEVVGDNYDMTKLEGCSDESYVELVVDETTREITEVKYYLQCGK